MSDTPFIPPSARLTGLVEFPAEGEVDKQQDSRVTEKDVKEKRKSHKSRRESKEDDKHSKKRQVSPSPDVSARQVKSAPVQVKPPVQVQATSGPEVVQKTKPKPTPVSTVASDPEQKEFFLPGATGQGLAQPGSSGQAPLLLVLTVLHRSRIPWTLTLLSLKPVTLRIRFLMKVKYPLMLWKDQNRQKI